MNKNKSLSIVIISLLCLAFYAALYTTTASAEPAYNVTFSETGLASGISWSVTLDDTTVTSTTSTVMFQGIADGTHSYIINAPTGYDTSTTSDTLIVNGANSQHSVTFTAQSYNWWMSGNGVTHNGYSTSPAPLTSNLLWTQSIGGFMMGMMGSSPAVVDGILYLANGDFDNLDVVNATTGALITTYNVGTYIDSSSPAVCNGIIYIGAGDGTVLAINDSTGSSVWTYSTGSTIESSPAVDNGVLYIGSDDNKAYAFDAADGTLLWSHTTGGAVSSSPAVAYGIVFISSNDGNTYALNATSGTELWHYGISGDSVTSPAVADGIVYSSFYDGNGVGMTVALNVTTGAEIWTSSMVDLGSVAIAHGMVYLCVYGGSMCALNATTGSQIWVGATSDYTRGQPVVAGSMLYYSDFMQLHAVNAFTGEEIWNQYVDMFESEGTSPVIANGILYISSGWGELNAYGSLDQHTLTMNTVGQGTVNPGNQTYAVGSYVDLEAIPADGWTFSGWSGDASGTTNTSITIDTDKTVTATFTQETYSLTIITVGQGTVLPGNQSYPLGTNVDLVAIPADGWIFSGWSGDASGATNTSITIDSDKTITANFTRTYNLTVRLFVDDVLTDNETMTFVEGQVFSGEVDLDNMPPEWTFDHLGIDGVNTTDISFSVTMNQDHLIEVFDVTTSLQLNITESVGGATNLTSGVHIYPYGSEVNITATAAPGYIFSNWIIGDETNSSNPITLTLDSNLTLTPVFIEESNNTPNVFNVIFNQNGLASGTSWSVTFNGVTQTSTTDTITFTGYADGDYTYTLTAPNGYATADYSGTLTIAGSDISKTIAFTQSNSNTIIATETTDNTTYAVQIGGNVTVDQFSNMTITPNQDLKITTVNFNLTGPAGTEGFCYLTLPKIAIPFGTNPVVYIDGVVAENQLCTEDSDNFYITYTTHFSTHQIDVVFTTQTYPSTISIPRFYWTISQPSINSSHPTTSPTPSPSPTATPTSTTNPSPTPTITLATIGQYVTVIAAIIILGAVTMGLMQKRKHPTKAP